MIKFDRYAGVSYTTSLQVTFGNKWSEVVVIRRSGKSTRYHNCLMRTSRARRMLNNVRKHIRSLGIPTLSNLSGAHKHYVHMMW